ncbi:MAG: ABC transporter permease, partial [Coriobacteriales bacterium]
MGTTFVITLKTALRDKSVLIWAIIFPLLLTVLFYMAFSGLDNLNKFDPVGVVVVNDSNYKNSSFKDVVETLSEEGDDQILDLTLVPDVDTAKRTLASGAGYGYYTVDEDGDPSLYLNETDAVSSMTTTQVDCMICKNIADTYIRYKDTFEKIIEENPEILRDTNVLENLLGSSDEQFTQSVTVTPNEASETVRYYYALLGFAAIMTCNVALATIPKCLSGTSIVGSRRNMSPEPKSRMILSTFLASWVLSFIFLLIVFMFLIFVIGVNFSGREGYCLIGLLLASLVANAMGTAIGVIPKISEGSKGGISAGIV